MPMECYGVVEECLDEKASWEKYLKKYRQMTEKDMIDFLTSMESRERYLEKRCRTLYRNIETLEEAIERISLAGMEMDSAVIGSSGNNPDPAYRVMIKSREEVKISVDNVAEELMEIMEIKKQISLIKQIIDKLPLGQGNLLLELYYYNGGCTWEEYQRNHNVSHSALSRERKRAIGNLCVIYNMQIAEN